MWPQSIKKPLANRNLKKKIKDVLQTHFLKVSKKEKKK
jgi:hypothetical protein